MNNPNCQTLYRWKMNVLPKHCPDPLQTAWSHWRMWPTGLPKYIFPLYLTQNNQTKRIWNVTSQTQTEETGGDKLEEISGLENTPEWWSIAEWWRMYLGEPRNLGAKIWGILSSLEHSHQEMEGTICVCHFPASPSVFVFHGYSNKLQQNLWLKETHLLYIYGTFDLL